MAITYSNSLAADRGTATNNKLNGGTLEILDGSSVLLASLALSSPAGTVSNKTLTFGTITSATIGNTGTAASAQLKDSSGTVHISGLTVGTSGTNVIVNTTSFVSGKNCSVSSCVITHP